MGMLRVLCVSALCVLTAGCVIDEINKIKVDTAREAEGMLTEEIARDCSDRVLKEYPFLTFTAPLKFSPRAAIRVAGEQYYSRMDNLVTLIGPTVNKNLFGMDNPGHAGCSYFLENGKLVLQKVHGIFDFGPKYIYIR